MKLRPISPTFIEIFDFTQDELNKLEKLLSFKDIKVKYEIERFKNAFWFVNKYGREAYEEHLQELRSKEVRSLVLNRNGKVVTYSGLQDRILASFNVVVEPTEDKLLTKTTLPWTKIPPELRYYQKEAVSSLLKNNHASVSLPTGSGKSFIILNLVKELGLKTLVMAPSVSISNQLFDTFTEHLGSRYVGKYGDGKKEYKKLITIGTAQSLTKIKKDSLPYDELSKVDLFLADECFPYDTGVFTDKGVKPIGAIASAFKNGEDIKVLSYNENIKKFEYKKIISSKISVKEDLLKISFTNSSIICTYNHPFLTKNREWVYAKDLKTDDLILGYDSSSSSNSGGPILSYDQEQIILGSYLGDGSITKHGKRVRLRVNHSIKQSSYCEFKAKMLDSKIKFYKNNGFTKNNGLEIDAVRFCTKTFFSKLSFSEKKKINQDIINNMDWMAIAIWFMDDGHRSEKSARIHTNSFSYEEVEMLCQKLTTMGVENKIATERKSDGRNWPIITISTDGFDFFSKKIAQYVHPSMAYKVLEKDQPFVGSFLWKKSEDEAREFCINKIEFCVKTSERRASQIMVYDIGVQDNHNFIVANGRKSPKSGIIAHNCHTLPASTFESVCSGIVENATCRYFFSATQMRNDGSDLLLDGIVGPIVYEKTTTDMVNEGFLAKPTFMVLNVESSSNHSSKDPIKMLSSHLYNNAELHQYVADLANASVETLGHKVMIMIDQVTQFKYLYPRLKGRIAFAHGGGMSKENMSEIPERFHKSDSDQLVADFNAGKLDILVGTSCIAVGTDIKPVNIIYNLQGGKSEIKFKQLIGRGTRLAPNKNKFWFVDFDIRNIPMLHNQTKSRIEIYRDFYDNIVFK
jgi:superfamily II DNA or RNA helicase